ncbi:MAG: ISKra4 family transposase, partial [Candidatus Dormibacteraeota bacterium]|nr:ISKra4 family transposase [Candidatus Dormibacteraeota bacterium]
MEQARRRDLQGLVGDYTVRRPTYTCRGCGQGHAPLDAEIGLGAGALSPGLARVVCRGGIEDSFSDATDVLAETLGVQIRPDLERRTTEGMGMVAEAAQQATIAALRQGQTPPAPEGAALVAVEVDGVQVPLLDGWHEMKVGRVAPLEPRLRHHADSGRTHLALGPSVCCAGLETAEVFWYRVAAVAGDGGLGRATRTVVVLGDGADWIWHRAAHFVGAPGREVVEIVDIYHAYEHLWAVGNAVFGRDTLPARVWVERLKDRLYEEGVAPVLAALDALAPPTEAATEEVRTARGYFADHAARMDYPAFVARQFPVGSGAIESMCKMLIEEREKGSGMRWSARGAQAVATLRALHRSGQWAAFWQRHPQRQHLTLSPRARPARRAPTPPAPNVRPPAPAAPAPA